jgi:hypothetical protein
MEVDDLRENEECRAKKLSCGDAARGEAITPWGQGAGGAEAGEFKLGVRVEERNARMVHASRGKACRKKNREL